MIIPAVDRLSRDTTDLLVIARDLQKAGAGLRSIAEPVVDTTSDFAELVLAMLGVAAKLERRRIKERTARGRADAKAKGVKFGRKPKLTQHQQREAIKRRDKEGETLRSIAPQLQCQRGDDFEARPLITDYKIRVSKDRLRAMPVGERSLFILLGYAANQLNLFSKLTLFSLNNMTDKEPANFLSGAQSQMLLRMAVGVIHEAWTKIVTTRVMQTPLGKEYLPRLDQEGKDALTSLKKLFGGSGLLASIRNNYAFHHPYDADVEAAFERAATEFPMG